jgi:uncharacterized DUF497 family protein
MSLRIRTRCLSRTAPTYREKRRWHALGLAGGVAVLLVVHTVREEGESETIRLISARQATRKERNRYEQSRTQNLG